MHPALCRSRDQPEMTATLSCPANRVEGSLSRSQDVIFGAVLVVGGVAGVERFVGVTYDFIPWLARLGGQEIAAMVSGPIIVFRLLFAPYWMWQKVTKKISAFTKIGRPRRKFTCS